MDRELERFKTEIDLRDYAASFGFALNRRRSRRGSAVMERGQQDKIIITRDSDGHYVYLSVKADHSGTIIDLAKRYESHEVSLAQVHEWLGRGSSNPNETSRRQRLKEALDVASPRVVKNATISGGPRSP